MKVIDINRLIKNHIPQSLLKYNVHKDLIFVQECDFFIKGYDFESRGNDDLDLAVWYFVQPLFVKSDCLYYNFGNRLSYKRKVNILKSKELEWWDARKENWDVTFKSIFDTIQINGEKKIGKKLSAESFYKEFYKERKDNIRVFEAVAYSTVLFGNEDLQNKLIIDLINFCNSQIESKNDEVEIQIKNDATLLLEANSTERRMLILKNWANETIKNLKLLHLLPFEV